ncbi:adenylate/guanylate cyclase domain-containing protein [Leptospira sp. 96542]|nr:adenylate/guanylate cyclase domain-containing protein [Leptospira sp. 96542]
MGKIITYFVTFIIVSCSQVPNLTAVKGYLAIANETLEVQGKTSLNGDWEFYPNEMYGESLFLKILSNDRDYIKVPSTWNANLNSDHSGDGYATYRLVLKIPDPNMRYYIRVQPPTSSFELYVNRQKIASSGVVGNSKETSIPKYQIHYVSFQPESYEQEILVVVSNYFHSRGGFRKPMEIGTKEVIQNRSIIYSAGEVFVFGAMLCMALYQLTVFMLRRQEVSSFYFAMFCFFTGLRLVILDNYYIVYLFPNFSWEWMQKIDYITAPMLVSFFIGYLKSLYPGKTDVPRWMVVVSWSFGIIYSLFVLVFSAKIYTETNVVSLVNVLFFSICSFYITFKVYRQKKKESSLIFYGSILLIFGSTHDLLSGNNWFYSQPIMPFFLFIFFLFQSILLSKRNARIYSTMEVMTNELSEVNEELHASNKAYAKFVPLRLIQLFGSQNQTKVKRGDFIVRQMSVLSSDIRDFTSISEALSPEENFLFLNDYLRQVGPIIRAENGFIEKYVGDAIFALFERKPEDALRAAISMHQTISRWNKEKKIHRIGEIQIGVGIHYGELMLGIIGEEQRIETAVLSDSMGIANSLESLTKKYGAKIIISLDALLELESPDSYPHRLLDFIKIPAKQALVGIAQVLIEGVEENYSIKLKTKVRFEESVNLFWDGEYGVAKIGFEWVLKQDPTDKAATLYLQKTSQFAENGPPPGFEKGILA